MQCHEILSSLIQYGNLNARVFRARELINQFGWKDTGTASPVLRDRDFNIISENLSCLHSCQFNRSRLPNSRPRRPTSELGLELTDLPASTLQSEALLLPTHRRPQTSVHISPRNAKGPSASSGHECHQELRHRHVKCLIAENLTFMQVS